MKRHLRIHPGDSFRIDGELYEFERCLPSGEGALVDADLYRFKNMRGRELTVDQQELDELQVGARLQPLRVYQHPNDRTMEEVEAQGSDPRRDKRIIRQHLLRAYDVSPVSKSDKALEAFIVEAMTKAPFASDWRPSAGSLRRWLNARGCPGDRRLRFMGDRFQHGPSTSTLPPLVQTIVAEKAEAYWANRQVTAQDVYQDVVAEIANRDRGLGTVTPRPHYTTVWRYLKRELTYDRAARRLGRMKAQQLFTAIRGSLEADRILEMAILDHTVVDCWVYDDERHIPIGRPTLSILLDVKSRAPLGYYLGFEPPGLHAAMACIRRAVVPKLDLAKRFPAVKGEWIAYGVPETILVDRGLEFISTSFIDACEDIGISLEYAPARTPQYKGAGERFFRTLNQLLFHKSPGGVPLKAHEMKAAEFDPEAAAILTLDELEELIYRAIVEVYCREPHSTLGEAPEKVWRDREPIDGIPIVDASSIGAAMGIAVSNKTLSRKGVLHGGLTYRSEAVSQLLQDLLPLEPVRGRSEGTVKVKIKVHPDDLGSIDVWNHATNRYVPLPCVEAEYASGLTAFHHKVIQEWRQQERIAFNSPDEMALARRALAEEMNARIPARIRDRKRQQRLSPTRSPMVRDVVMNLVPSGERRSTPYEVLNSTQLNRVQGQAPTRGKSLRTRGRSAVSASPPPARVAAPLPTFSEAEVLALIAGAREGGA